MTLTGKIGFILGNEAIVEGALVSGATFFAGYPITPSSEIAERASRRLPQVGGYYLQMEDEIASIAAIIGASIGGAKAFTATSGPGFSLMQENIGLAVMAEVPCVIINVQRSGPSTGLATKPAQADIMQARWGRHGDHSIIAISPSTVQECFDLIIFAFNVAETYRCPVLFMADATVGHLREGCVLRSKDEVEIINRKRPPEGLDEYYPYKADEDLVPPMATLGGHYLARFHSSSHNEKGLPTSSPEEAKDLIKRLYDKIEKNKDKIVKYKTFDVDGSDYLLIAFGGAVRAARQAALDAKKRGLKVGVLQLQTVWPFPAEYVCELAKDKKGVVVPEMNMGQIIGEVRKAVPDAIPVVGANRYDGEPLAPYEIMKALDEVLSL
ncbi:MAG TPA: 2-oxoacid:acceptor oxidoreductase subunit alpha [Acetomicrobium sp.]|uniref:2-oxoacid:acceptor oxidoreductase subunit alpha n=1 Tax=Acetomicrobium mobile TaxID=97477 RepID=UPI0026F25DAE|nr:2-oxoacid:acceptor oxidoreductase subunit alpha [Acetomicrobium mobile]HOB10855.1 2-oxoacid:acceptor oxidoreductase subunit alpha [Acetomicrobium sp.]HQA36557.1 2-oxoacid:acceptor oxidoreductase subunit alpha [Acetomicrobium sp.]HQC88178.1 2-oxoacid:acceptor oxidoreductase subunit alpha [Acetomicrobium sp.]